jgi:hypothetical protein
MAINAYNNLFYESSVGFGDGGDHRPNFYITFKDNLFHRCTISGNDSIYSYDCDYNGYSTNYDRLTPSSPHDVILTSNIAFEAGPLGQYYQPTNSLLINAGSRNATNAALYHYTTLTNQVKETNSIVDIGFHYVAVDGSGNPIDTDGDGLADYFEDSNGDGVYNTGDISNFNNSDTDGDGVSDYLEWLQGRNPRIPNTVSDSGNLIKLRVYTPLK